MTVSLRKFNLYLSNGAVVPVLARHYDEIVKPLKRGRWLDADGWHINPAHVVMVREEL